jgi:hypothetical protein
MLLQPLFGTAFLLEDQLAEADFDGAETIVISSASSKTALATAFLLRRRSTLIGMTHWERLGGGGDLPGPAPTFFFAPDQAAKRRDDWSGAGLRDRMAAAWAPFVEWTGGWLRVSERSGGEALQKAYLELLDGDVDPAQGIVCGANLRGQT